MNIDEIRKAATEVLQPTDDGYEEARRIWNARFSRRPEVIVRCHDAEEVTAAIELARDTERPLSVKSGGHSYSGKNVGEGGVLIDLSALQTVEVDPDERSARVGSGVTWGEFDRVAQANGLATSGGTVSTVGVAGLTLGGGSGNVSRQLGLALDNLTGVEVVTADGSILRADEDENADLFWALRGGTGNFGVVTSFDFRLHEIGPEVLSGQIIYPFDDAAELLRAYRDFMAGAPDELQCYPFMFRVPPIDPFPEEYHGKPVVDFVVFHSDPDAVAAVQPLRDLGEKVLEFVAPTTYVEAQQTFDANLPSGNRYYTKAHQFDEISDEAIEAVTAYVPEMRGALTAAYFEPLGGAIARVDRSATAFGPRDAAYNFHILAGWMDESEDDEVMAWARTFHNAMAPTARGSVYVNLLAEDEDNRVPAAYGDNYARLARLKKQWDPDNLFSTNYNIAPAD